MISYSVDISALEKLRERLAQFPEISKRHLEKAIAGATVAVHKQARRDIVPWKTGSLARTMGFSTNKANLSGKVFPTRSYAFYVHEGTKPHIIMPLTKKALFWPGASHPVKSVRHPGSKKNPFLVTMREEAMPEVIEIFGTTVDNINKEIAKRV